MLHDVIEHDDVLLIVLKQYEDESHQQIKIVRLLLHSLEIDILNSRINQNSVNNIPTRQEWVIFQE